MRITKIFMLMTLVIVLLSSAMAYSVDLTINGNIPLGASSYFCAGDTCTSGSISFVEQELDPSTVIMDFDDSNAADDPDVYAIYVYPQDECHLGSMVTLSFDDSSSDISTHWNFYKQDADHCGSEVVDPIIKIDGIETACAQISANTWDCGIVPEGSEIDFSANLLGAWGYPLDFAPAALEKYYTSYVHVDFSVNSVILESEDFDITPGEAAERKEYSYTLGSEGDYILRIATNMEDDCKCEYRDDQTRSNYKYKEVIFTVEEGDIPEFTLIGMGALVALIGLFVYMRR